MANKKYTDVNTGTVYTDSVILVANPTTGALKRVTVAALLAASGTEPGGGGGDITPPTVSTKAVANSTPSVIDVTFSESVTVTTAGWSAKKNGSAWSISSVTGSGTSWSFTMGSAAANGDTLLISYDSTTGATVDGSANELASFTDSSVTNNVSGASLEDLVLNTSNGLSVSGTTWTGANSPSGNWEDNFGIATKKLATGTDGYFRLRITSTDSEPALGIQDANANNKYNGADTWNIGFFCAGGTLYYWNGSLVDTTVGYSNGDYIRMIRTSGTWKLQKSPDASSWTDAHTFVESLTGDAWCIPTAKDNATKNKIYEPKGYNVV